MKATLHDSRTGRGTGTWNDGMKNLTAYFINMQKQFNEGKTAFPTNGAWSY
jgi:maltose-binding protein MalE